MVTKTRAWSNSILCDLGHTGFFTAQPIDRFSWMQPDRSRFEGGVDAVSRSRFQGTDWVAMVRERTGDQEGYDTTSSPYRAEMTT